MGEGQTDHVHDVQRRHADTAPIQRSAGQLAQVHVVVTVVGLHLTEANPRIERGTYRVANQVTVGNVPVLAGLNDRAGWGGLLADGGQKLGIGLLDGAICVVQTSVTQRGMGCERGERGGDAGTARGIGCQYARLNLLDGFHGVLWELDGALGGKKLLRDWRHIDEILVTVGSDLAECLDRVQ
ncbi:hypothetical protein D3C81_1735870 [compost metagenome]